MRVLVACEFSGIVRDAFLKRGHDAWSCDLLPTDRQTDRHRQCDVLEILDEGWDLMIAHPPCTYLSVVGNRHMKNPGREEQRKCAADFFMRLVECNIEKWCIENPVGCMSRLYRKPDQIVHPYYFGEPHLKRTCFWLKNLSPLEYESTKITKPDPLFIDSNGKKHYATAADYKIKENSHMPRWARRSKFWPSIANAMATQWGGLQ